MWLKVGQFVWSHFWKMLSAGLTLFCIWFVDSVQQPEKVRASIDQNAQHIAMLRDENLKFQIALGTNNILYEKIDRKMDNISNAMMSISVEMKAMNNKR